LNTRRPYPEQGALARARAVLLEVGLEVPVRAWTDLALILGTAWLPVLPHATPSVARILRRRLAPLLAPPLALSAAWARPRGEIVHLAGTASPFVAGSRAPLWQVTRTEDESGAWLTEEAEDFLLTDPDGDRACVVVDEAHLIGAETLHPGQPVSVFGFLDEIPDRLGLARSPHGRVGVILALQSRSDWPLLVIPRGAAPPAGEPQRPAPVVT
jgi:hypothetical protein